MIFRAFRYRIFPTADQKTLMVRNFGCVRYIYNWGLARKVASYHKHGKYETFFDLNKCLPRLKSEHPWLSEANSQSLQQAMKRVDTAFTRFFREKGGFPKFKSKKRRKDSFQVPQGGSVCWEKNTIKLPKIGLVPAALNRTFVGKIKTITISRVPSGKFYASVLVEMRGELPSKPPIRPETTIGIDVGLKTYATLSNGEKFNNPRHLTKMQRRLAYKQYVLHKADRINKKKGVLNSKRRERQRVKAACLHERVTNQRNDFLHKLAHRLTHDNQVETIVVEDLAVSNMMRNHRLARAIGDAAWGKFYAFLSYKCEWYGKNLLTIGRFEPSSKMCSSCGVINHNLTLSDREWKCDCGVVHDRDINASINIKSFGLHKQNQVGGGSRRTNAHGVWSVGTD